MTVDPFVLVLLIAMGLLATWQVVRALMPLKPVRALGPPEAGPSGRWNTIIIDDHTQGPHGDRGTFTLWQGWLRLEREHVDHPEWTLPCAQLSARYRPGGSRGRTNIALSGPFGSMHVLVSQEPVTKYPQMGNNSNPNGARQRRYAAVFMEQLRTSGASIT